jgi:hypothetical protein
MKGIEIFVLKVLVLFMCNPWYENDVAYLLYIDNRKGEKYLCN